ncbi:MAG: MMPL family transporter [Desulfatitalea sp.]|nr:MMPL family transporter [Desulfatitalea sp.]NNJ99659.1 MMPL family transporter [Desulfatitalea sp.]
MNMNTVLDRVCRFCTRRRVAVMMITLAVTVIFSCGLFKIKSDVILFELFPYDHPYMQLVQKFSKVFGGGGTTAVIAVSRRNGDIFNTKTLSKIKGIADEINLWHEVYRQLTTSIASQNSKVTIAQALGEIQVAPLMWPDLPKTDEEIAKLKHLVFSNKLYNGVLVSEDGAAGLIIAEFKEDISYARVHQLLDDVITRYGDENTDIHIVGFPVLMGYVDSFKPQMKFVFAVSIALIIFILLCIFRNLIGMLSPLIVGLISTMVGIGFVGWIGINFSPLIYVLAFLVGARIVSHAVQITHRYFEELNAVDGNDKHTACYRTMRAMIVPNVAGVLTDAAGFLVLIFAKIILMQHIAVIMTFWMLSIAFSAILTPIICTFIPAGEKTIKALAENKKKVGFLDKAILGAAQWSIGRGRFTLSAILVVLCVVFTFQATKLKTGDATPGSPLLWPDHKYNLDQQFINERFKASSEAFTLYFDGKPESIYDSEMNMLLQKFDNHMAAALPDIYKFSSSAVNICKQMNLVYHDGDYIWNEMPREQNKLTGVIGQVKNQMGGGTMNRFWDDDLSKTQITLFFADHTADNVKRIYEAAKAFFKDHPAKIESGVFRMAGGGIGLEIALNEEMKQAHAFIDTTVLITIFIMCSLCFRSFVAGLMLALPLMIANLGAFAYMATMDIGISVNTLPIAAVGVGVGVDFAIYLYSRVVEEYTPERGWAESIMASVRTCGKAIVFTGTALILPILPWYFISALKFQAQMGFFLSMLLLVNVVLALTLHPLLIYLIKPRFIQKGNHRISGVGA